VFHTSPRHEKKTYVVKFAIAAVGIFVRKKNRAGTLQRSLATLILLKAGPTHKELREMFTTTEPGIPRLLQRYPSTSHLARWLQIHSGFRFTVGPD